MEEKGVEAWSSCAMRGEEDRIVDQACAPLRGAGGTALRAGGALVGRGIWPKMGKAMPFSLVKVHKFRH